MPIVWGFGIRDSGRRLFGDSGLAIRDADLFGDSGFTIRDADYLRGRGLAIASPPINCESTD